MYRSIYPSSSFALCSEAASETVSACLKLCPGLHNPVFTPCWALSGLGKPWLSLSFVCLLSFSP